MSFIIREVSWLSIVLHSISLCANLVSYLIFFNAFIGFKISNNTLVTLLDLLWCLKDIIWEFYTLYIGHIHVSSNSSHSHSLPFNIHPTLCSHPSATHPNSTSSVRAAYVTYSLVCGHPLEHGWPIRGPTLKEHSLCLCGRYSQQFLNYGWSLMLVSYLHAGILSHTGLVHAS